MGNLLRTCRGASAAAAVSCALMLAAACSGPPPAHPHAAATPGPAQRPAAGSSPSARPAASSPMVPTPTPTLAPPSPAPSRSAAVLSSGRPCPTSALSASVGRANGAAGSIYYPLDFTNTSGEACTMFGYPGVSFVSGIAGRRLGGSALRNATFAPHTVLLSPGATAHASMQVIVAQNYPASTCKPATAHWLRVYPPDQFAATYVQFTAVTCTGAVPGGSTLGIYVVRPGSTGP